MLRFVLALASLLLLLGMPADRAPAACADLALEADVACHCCDDDDEAGGDCCDWDFGACCATGTVAALPNGRVQLAQHATALPEGHAFAPIHLLQPRDNGPPPTPPPIG